ncbi:chorismate mutase [Lentzea terrae]|uniref:chorismate mutase n=1 Tax=Lentzea terrae TaxID=2200761 RepID=UPI0022B8148B|nr:chorismate mutase [Lentzea terrae]
MSSCARRSSSFSTGSGLRLPWSSSAEQATTKPRSPRTPGLRSLPGQGLEESRGRQTMDTTTEPDINELRQEIDHLDAEILRLVQRRVEISKIIGAARMAAGGTKIVHNREIDVLNRYKPLGPEGKDLAMILLKMGRGPLGR